MTSPLICKLERGADLTPEDRTKLQSIIRHPRHV